MQQNEAGKRPRGKEEVRSALIKAANELFGVKGPDAVPVRDVAMNADVNHALLHRHFGSKEQLLRDVMAEHAASFLKSSTNASTANEAVNRMFDLMVANPAFVRIVAHLSLNGHQPDEFVTRDGGLAHIVGLLLKTDGASDPAAVDEARLRAATVAAFSMGWLLFESFVLYASGFEGEEEVARAFVSRQIAALLR